MNKKFLDMSDLSQMNMRPPFWFINEILPEGITLVVAKPKVGKSALVLYLILQIILKNKIWNRFDTNASKILYMPFDDPMRRIKERLEGICESSGIEQYTTLENITLYNKECLTMLKVNENMEEYFQDIKNQGFKLVIIDTLTEGIEFNRLDSNIYKNDYRNMSLIKQVTEKLGLSLILIHHEKKGYDLDVIDSISGSNGISAAVDTIWRLSDDKYDGCKNLEVRGKEVEPNVFKLRMNDSLIWSLDPTEEPIYSYDITPEQKEVSEFLLKENRILKTGEIAAHFKKSIADVSQLLKKLLNKKYIERVSYGSYRAIIRS